MFGWMVPDDLRTSLVSPSGQVMSNEGPFYIWRTKRGYHMLTHCQLQPHSLTRGTYGWTLLPDLMYMWNMTWSNGSDFSIIFLLEHRIQYSYSVNYS